MEKYTFESNQDTPINAPLSDDLKNAIRFAGQITQDLLMETKRASERLDSLVREAVAAGATPRTIRFDAGLSVEVAERIAAGDASWNIFTENSAS